MSTINCRYEIIQKIGEGSSGIVYRVRDLMFGGTERALKIISLQDIGRERGALLRNEFSVLRRFDHPSIVKVHDIGYVIADDSGAHIGNLFFSLDYIEGDDLFRATENADDEVIASLIFQIAHALDYIHRHGLIHSDIKPANVIVTKVTMNDITVPVPKIIDFGFTSPNAGLQQDSVKGSLHYIAPELIAGREFDDRIDLYSLGVTLYQILTRSLPYSAQDTVELLKKQRNEIPVDIAALRPGTAPELRKLVSLLMQKDPHRRLPDARSAMEIVKPLIRDARLIRNSKAGIPFAEVAGRKKELNRLAGFIRRNNNPEEGPKNHDRKKVICIAGEQGAGKSPLLQEWRRLAQTEGILTLNVQCYLKTSPPLEPFRLFLHELRYAVLPHGTQAHQLLTTYNNIFSALAMDVTEGIQEEHRLNFASEEHQSEFLRSIVSLVKEAHAVVPLVITVDDVHHADEMSLQLFRHLVQTMDQSTPLIVMTCETVETIEAELGAGPGLIEAIVLKGYTVEGIRDVIQVQFGVRDIPKDLPEELLAVIGDAPYLIKEYLQQFHHLPSAQAIEELQKSLHTPELRADFPRSISDINRRRFLQYSSEEQHLLNVLSCFRIPVRIEILKKISSLVAGHLSHHLAMLTMSGVLTYIDNANKVYFTHPSFRMFVYQNVLTGKKELQMHIAAELEKDSLSRHEAELAEIGYHYSEAGNRDKAFYYYLRAAERAASAYSVRESISLLEEALPLVSNDTDRESVLEKLAHRNDLVENYDKAEAMYKILVAQFGSTDAKNFHYRKALGSIQIRRGKLEDAAETLTRALRAASVPGQVMEVEDELADIDIASGRLSEARARCVKALDRVDATADDVLRSSLVTKLGIISFYEMKYDDATKYFHDAFKILEHSGDKTKLIAPLLNLGNISSVQHQYKDAFDHWSRALHFAEEVGNLHQQGQIYNNLGIAEYSRGRLDNAVQNYLKGITIFKKLGNAPGIALCLSNLGEVHFILSEYEKALDVWEECLEYRLRMSDIPGQVETNNNLCRLFLKFEDTGNAEKHLRESRRLMENTRIEAKWPIYYLCSSQCAMTQKKLDDAERYIHQAQEKFKSTGDDINYCGSLIVAGRIYRLLDRRKESAKYFQDALKTAMELHLPLLQAEALLEAAIESRSVPREFEKKTLNYLKEAYQLIERESVTDITWKICFEMGKELWIRGLGVKSRVFFIQAKRSLLYLSSLNTRQLLQQKFWESDRRAAVMRELEALTDDTIGQGNG